MIEHTGSNCDEFVWTFEKYFAILSSTLSKAKTPSSEGF